MAGDILNPNGCLTPEPFVLTIDPSNSTGSVRGWLESAAGLVFEDQLPRFVRGFDLSVPIGAAAIALWWSIGMVDVGDGGSLYFYAGDFTGTDTEIAVASGARGLYDIDLDALDFSMQVFEAKTGTILVFRDASTRETVAVRMDRIYFAGATQDTPCSAVDASWRFLE
jgi:hypothetical protein